MTEFSVIIPCKNAERTIGQCISSAANQTHEPVQIIIIDDQSEDDSLESIESTAVDLELIHTNGVGGAGARNAGIRRAKGDWIAFLDADDVWYPNHLTSACKLISGNTCVGYISHYDWLALDGNSVIAKKCRYSGVVQGHGVEQYLDLYVRYKHFVGMSACIVDRKRAMKVGGFDEEMIRRHDIDFWLRVIENQSWVFDPIASAAYRKHTPGSLSSNQASAALYRFIAFSRIRKAMKNSSVYEALIKKFALQALLKSDVLGTDQDRLYAHKLAYSSLSNTQKLLYKILKQSSVISQLFLKLT